MPSSLLERRTRQLAFLALKWREGSRGIASHVREARRLSELGSPEATQLQVDVFCPALGGDEDLRDLRGDGVGDNDHTTTRLRDHAT